MQRSTFELGVNLALYAAGKSELKNRLESDTLAMPGDKPAASISLARVRYDGNWDPEPAAWPRGATLVPSTNRPGHRPRIRSDGRPGAIQRPASRISYGTGKLNLTEAQIKSDKKYVENGGVLLIEPCGMPDEFSPKRSR